MATFVIVVESTEFGVEAVHGPYAMEEVTRAQAIVRSQPSDRSRRATIVKLSPDATAPGGGLDTGALLDSVLARYDGLVSISKTTLAGLFDAANSTGHYEQADELQEALTEQRAEIADALVSLLRKGFIEATETPEVGYRLAAGHPLSDDIVAMRNATRTDAWRERKRIDPVVDWRRAGWPLQEEEES